MNWGKYIIVKHNGCELPIMFDKIISHADFLDLYPHDFIISAGFFEVSGEKDRNISVSCFGKSTTLKKELRQEDERMIKTVLRD